MILNKRDLGGYVAQDGRKVRSGMLLRSAHLADATDADIAYLKSLPVTLVVDFRTEVDLKGKTNRDIPGARYVNLPVDASGNAAATATEEEKKKVTGRKKFEVKKIIMFAAFNDKAKVIAREMYPTLLFDPECQQQFARFLRLVVDTENGTILYHCTQGKDRTGIASALLLAALGADRDTIVADFDATNKTYEKDVRKYSRRVRFWGGKEEEIAVVKAFLGCNTDNFIKALDAVDSKYGSMEAYLKGPMGLTDEDILILRDRYLISGTGEKSGKNSP
ncbi:MAG: tyrosine-protein phosphatase [Bacteroidales bacterium]|nr:tyrosine-protein phosphatase [Bacteroidales bacterium]